MADLDQETSPNLKQDQKDLLAIALNHTWQWYDFRHGQAAQLVNFFTLGAAVMATAYVAAINAGHRGTATAIALLGSLLTATTYVIGTRLTSIAHLAHEPLKEIQGRLAESVNIETMRLLERRESRQGALSQSGAVATIMFIIVTIVCLVAAGFAWFGS